MLNPDKAVRIKFLEGMSNENMENTEIKHHINEITFVYEREFHSKGGSSNIKRQHYARSSIWDIGVLQKMWKILK